MSKVTFETELNDEALGALRSYLAKRNEQLDMRLSEQLEKLYAATVPAAVREMQKWTASMPSGNF